MIISEGKDDFKNNSFDKFRWSANTYETPAEIFACLVRLGVFKKKIKGISAIGALLYYSLGDWKRQAYNTLEEAGIVTYDENVAGWVELRDENRRRVDEDSELLKNVSTARSVTLYEPLLIIFEDDTVLELLPCATKGLRIGYNTLPKNMRNGMNRSEFDIGTLFNSYLVGKSFSYMSVVSTETTTSYINMERRKNRVRKRKQYIFEFTSGKLVLEELQCSAYELSITRPYYVKCAELATLGEESNQMSFMRDVAVQGALISSR